MEKNKRSVSMVVMATVMLLFLGMVYAWSMFRAEIAKVFPEFTAAELSMNFTITMIGFALGGFFGGKISARYSQSLAVRVAAVMLLAGYMGVSFMGNLPGRQALILMYICYGAVCGLGTGIGYNACLTGVSPWFPERMGLVSGVLLMGFGFGSLLLGLLAQSLSASIGVFNVFRIYAAVIASVLIIGSFFLKKPPAGQGKDSARPSGETDSCTPVQMLARPSFWIYFLWNVIMGAAGMLIINSAATIAVFYGAAAGLGLAVSVFNGGGRPLAGLIMDKLGQFKGMLLINVILIAAGLLLMLTSVSGSILTMCAGMFTVGVCYGGGVTISAKVISDVYGPEHYSVNFSLSNFCSIPAAVIGPYISGLLQDRSDGDYASTFVLLTVMAAVAFVLIFLLRAALGHERKNAAR